MKYLFKRYWFIILFSIIINLPILIFGVIRTNKSILLTGDTSLVSNFVEIDNSYKSEGSFSTVSVMSIDHSTLLQNFIAGKSDTSYVYDMTDSYLHFNDFELSKMGSIQHTSSITYSIILAYKEAMKKDDNINIEYEFDAFVISYYGEKSDLRIGDRIIGINNIYGQSDFSKFRESFNNMQPNDILHVERKDKNLDIILDEDNYRQFGGYAYYDINMETVFPKYEILPTNVGGPSGGLLQTLALYDSLIEEDITKGKKIAGTGTINSDGIVGSIGGIQQKIYTAYADKIDVFLCPKENYEEALIAYNKLPKDCKMKLFSVNTFYEALEVLANV